MRYQPKISIFLRCKHTNTLLTIHRDYIFNAFINKHSSCSYFLEMTLSNISHFFLSFFPSSNVKNNNEKSIMLWEHNFFNYILYCFSIQKLFNSLKKVDRSIKYFLLQQVKARYSKVYLFTDSDTVLLACLQYFPTSALFHSPYIITLYTIKYCTKDH